MVNVGRATVDVDAELDRASIAKLGSRIEAALDKAGKRSGERFTNQFDIAMGRFAVRLGGITAVAPLAASAVSALSGSIVALSSSLFNAVSSSATLVGILGTLKQSTLVASIGFRNFEKAVTADTAKKFNDAIEHMAPAMIRVVKQLRGLSKEYFTFTKGVQTAIFGGTEKQIASLADVFLPLLQARFSETGRIFNSVFDQFVRFTQTTLFVSKFSKALNVNNDILRNLGKAAVPVLDGMLNLFLALQPSSERLSVSIANLSLRFQKATAGAAFAERVDAFMVRATTSAKLLGQFVGNLAGAFGNIFKAATPAGDSFLQTLVDITQKFQEFTASARGQSGIATWAKNSVDSMKAFGAIFQQFGSFFASISDPVILKGFTDVLASLAVTLNVLAPIISTFAIAMGRIASFVAPVLGPLLALGIAFSGFAFYAGLVTTIAGTLLGPLGVLSKVFGVLSKVVRVVAIAFRFLGAALLANPIVLIIAAIVALGVALVVAYKKSETFRNIVNGVWASIKTAAITAMTAISGFVIPIFNRIQSVITVTMNVIQNVVQVVWTVIKAVIYTNLLIIAGFIAINVVVIRTMITTAFNAILAVVNFIWPTISGIITTVLGVISAAVSFYFNLIRTVVTTVFNAIMAVVNFVWPTISSVITAVLGTISGVVSTVFNGIRTTITTVFNAVRSVISAGVSAWFSIISGIVGKIAGLAGRFFSAGRSLGKSVIDGLGAGLKAAGGFVSDIAGSIKRAINRTLGLPFTIRGPGPLPDFTIPAFATGVRNFDGGVALVGERGPELVNLSRGSDVHTASDTRDILGGGGGPVDLTKATIAALAAAIIEGADRVATNAVDANNISTGSGLDLR